MSSWGKKKPCLTFKDRKILEEMRHKKIGLEQLAEIVGMASSTVQAEYVRGGGRSIYDANRAQTYWDEHTSNGKCDKKRKKRAIKILVLTRFEETNE